MHARSIARALGAVVVALGVAAGAAGAQGKGKAQDKGQEKGKGAGQHVVQPAPRGGDAPANARGNGTPPGLAKKPGGMPPGQYKKRYRPDDGVVILRDVFGREGIRVIRVERSGDVRYVVYRTRTGATARATVRPGEERPVITGAPKSVMGKVLERMQ